MLPAIYLPFLIAFLPRSDQAGTGWVFGHAPALSRATVSDATWRALTTHVLLPTYAMALVFVVAIGPDRADRAAAVTYSFAVAALAAKLMSRIDRVPFTDDREEDRGLDLGALMTGALALGLLGALFGAALEPWLRWPVAAVAVAAAAWLLRARPLRAAPGDVATSFDAADEAPLQTPIAAAAAASSAEGTVGRELRAVAVLYVVLGVLPWIAGAVFAA